MTESKYEVSIASVPDREELVAELWVGGMLLGELRREGKATVIEVYSHPTGQPWVLEADRLCAMVAEAKSKLLAS